MLQCPVPYTTEDGDPIEHLRLPPAAKPPKPRPQGVPEAPEALGHRVPPTHRILGAAAGDTQQEDPVMGPPPLLTGLLLGLVDVP